MNPVRYALLQQSLEPPGIDQLRRAFSSVRCLVDSDAHGLANDAYGILVRDLAAEDAHRLQGALRTEGVETELLPVASLPQIPPTKFVRRIELGQDALLIFDPIGRPVPIEWRHLMLIAAGIVPPDRSSRWPDAGGRSTASGPRVWNLGSRDEGPSFHEADVAGVVLEWRTRSRSSPHQTGAGWSGGRDFRRETETEALLELVLTNGAARISLAMDGPRPVLFRCLGTRQTDAMPENLRLLVAELARLAPKAMLNRGAWFLQQSPPTLFGYPSRNAFFEEIIWMLHRAGKSR
jgi:hypothetical protein